MVRLSRPVGLLGSVLVVACGQDEPVVLLAYVSEQPRWQQVMECSSCERLDLADPELQPSKADVLVLDGHSNPPGNVLGRSLHDMEALVAAVEPRELVGVTCRLAELGTLTRLFEASEGLQRIIASPTTLPWDGFRNIAECCAAAAERGEESCAACLGDGVYTYDRADLSRLWQRARAQLEAIGRCEAGPRIDARRKHPPYLCVETGRAEAPLVAWRVDYADIRQHCPPGVAPRSIEYVACAPGDAAPALAMDAG